MLLLCVILIFSAFYSQIYTDEDTNSFLGKFSFAMFPILPSLVMISESSITQVLQHGISNGIDHDLLDSTDSFDELLTND